MNSVLIALFLVGFQAVYANGAPRSVSPRLNLTMHILKEFHEDKRAARCLSDKSDKKSCSYWKSRNFCSKQSRYHAFMEKNCYATCSNCQTASCLPDKYNKKSCSYWKSRNFCSKQSRYHAFMEKNCFATCSNCETASCLPDKYNKKSCSYWKSRNFCSKQSRHHAFMEKNCYATCSNCETARCLPDKYNKKSCSYWKSRNFCSKQSRYHAFMEKNCYATCSNCGRSSSKRPTKVKVASCLQAHNAKRARHGASPLVWDETLAQHAKQWAERLVSLGKLQHASGTGEGENLYWSRSSQVHTCLAAVNSWYSEEPYYPYNRPPQSVHEFNSAPKAYGHFTQIIWKATKKVGVALATKKAGQSIETFIVARYSPPGNVIGSFEANVARPRK